MIMEASAALPTGRASAHETQVRGNLPLRMAVLGCGVSSAFGIDLLGELFWAEILLPVLAVGATLANPPRQLFADRAFRMLILGIVAMFFGYVFSDMAAGTPSEMYQRGWARVAVLGSSAFSLCVLSHQDKRSLWWFCVGIAIGGVAANALAGVPLSHWKLGYGEPVAYLAAASGALLPMWAASVVVLLAGGLTILLDYRSLGAQLILTAAATFLRSRNVGLYRLIRNLPLLVLGFGLAAGGTLYLLNVSRGENQNRWEVSNLTRFAALRVGAKAIIDSPVVGYGSWGQGTKKYADMYYEATVGDLLAVGDDTIVGVQTRGGYFSAHSQIIQAWMEGGILAGAFFTAYMILMTKGFYQLLFTRPADYLTPLLLLIVGSNLWASVMSPFLGNQRITVALTVAVIVMLSMEGKKLHHRGSVSLQPRAQILRRPANLMR
jgi:hypothetical protein